MNKEEKREAYHKRKMEYQRKYYHEKVDKEKERLRKLDFYHANKERILEQMKIKYILKKQQGQVVQQQNEQNYNEIQV